MFYRLRSSVDGWSGYLRLYVKEPSADIDSVDPVWTSSKQTGTEWYPHYIETSVEEKYVVSAEVRQSSI